MSDIEGDSLECCKCGQQVEQILAMQCDHNLCLGCASKVVHKWQSITQAFICELCACPTQLDPTAVSVLMDMRESQQSSSCCTDYDYQNQVLDTKQSYHQGNITCPQHMTESTVLYCFTCESQCFCMECYLQGLHKNHEVRNINKSYDTIRDSANQMQTLLKSTTDTMLHEQCRLVNKKQELIELVSQAKMQIGTSFDELYRTLKQKEQELLNAADELVSDKLVEIENSVSKMKQNMDRVMLYQDQLLKYFNDNNPPVLQSVEACNYLVRERKKMQSLMDSIKMEKPLPIVQSRFCLDAVSLQQMIEDMRSVKLQVVSLRGVETSVPTQREKYIYQRAVEEREVVEEKEKENNNSSYSFIERSSQKKSRDSSSRDFQVRFNEAKRQILSQKTYI